MRVDRMLTIIVMLLNRPRISAKELADKFEVSVRTVYRDIEAINRAGIPIISYQGNNGGFGIMDNYKLTHQLLTFDNLSSILSTLKGINTSMEDSELDASIEKLRNLIPKDKTEQLKQQMEQIVIEKQPWVANKRHKEQMKQLRQAIADNKLMTITYQNYSGEISVRQIEPMSLVFKGYNWYLFAFCRLKEDYRLFRISRIHDSDIENFGFDHRHATYEQVYGEVISDHKMIKITLKFDSVVRTRVEDIFELGQIHELDTGEFMVTAEFPESDWYLALILSFGEYVEVVEPPEVRTEIHRRIAEMMDRYQ